MLPGTHLINDQLLQVLKGCHDTKFISPIQQMASATMTEHIPIIQLEVTDDRGIIRIR